MEKDFDAWGRQKKYIHWSTEGRIYSRREIWWAILGVNVGYEQDGTGSGVSRPVLILKDFNQYMCLAVPLTTSIKKTWHHIDLGLIEGKQSQAIISQIRLIDTRRLTEKISIIPWESFNKVRKNVRSMI